MRSLYAGNARSVMLRGWRATRSTNWLVIVSGFFEPVFYLLAMGIGLGTLIGDVDDRERAGGARTRRSSRRRCSRSPP